MESNLFTVAAFEELKNSDLKYEKRERKVYDHFITIDDLVFDAYDLYITLYEVHEGSNIDTEFGHKKTDVLKKYGILESEGSQSWMIRARLGPNGVEFIKMLEGMMFPNGDVE